MVEQVMLLSLAEISFGATAGLLAYYAWDHRGTPAGFPVFVLAVSGCLYAIANGLISMLGGQSLTLFLAHLQGALGAVVAVSVFYTAVAYTNQHWLLRRGVVAALVAFLVIDLGAFLTNPLHGLIYADAAVENGVFHRTRGDLLWVHNVVSFGLVAVGLAFLALAFSTRRVYRKQTAAMIAGIAVAAGVWLLELFVTLSPAFDLGTVGIVLGSTVLLWATTRTGLLETVPVARKTMMDSMDDYIIALDGDNRVIDINEAAKELLGVEGDVLGAPASEVFSAVPALAEQIESPDETDTEVTFQHDGTTRHYQLSSTPITYDWSPTRNGDSAQIGQLIVVIDITERRRRENELDLLKEVFARVLRHNLRNDLNVIKGNAAMMTERLDDSETRPVERVVDSTDNLLALSEKARDLETIIESPRERRRVDLATAVDRAVEQVANSYPDAVIDLAVDPPCYVYAHREVEMAVQNLVENSCEHDTDPPTTVTIRATAGADSVDLLIEDDGPGLPDHEVQVLEAQNETTLKHGSGLGLWIVNWVVNRSDAAIDIDADEGGTRVTLTFDRAPAPEARSRSEAAAE